MKIISLNCQSYSTAKKDIKALTENYDCDILCLTETWEQQNEKLTFKNWNILSKPRKENNHGGVAIFSRKSEYFVIERKQHLEKDNLEVICAHIKMQKGEDILLVVCYVPPTKHEDIKALLTLMDDVNKQYKNIIVTGDLNSKSKCWGNKTENYAGELLENYLFKSNFVCINDGLATRRHSDSVIDMVLVTPSLVPEIPCCQTLLHENVRSDHIAILTEIEDGVQVRQEQSTENYRLDKTDWSEWDAVTSEKFDAWNREVQLTENIDSLYTSFLETFTVCVETSVPKVKRHPDSRMRKPPWTSDEVKTAKSNLNNAKRHFKRRKTPHLLQELKEKEEAYDSVCEKAKSEWVEKTCDTINKCNNPKDKWLAFHKLTSYKETDGGVVLPLMNKDNMPVFDQQSKCSILEDTFFSGAHIRNEDFDEEFQKSIENEKAGIRSDSQVDEEDFLNRTISRDEVEAALQRLETGKAAGPDNIYTDLIKKSNNTLIAAITTLFQQSFKCGKLPSSWKTANVKFLQKPGKDSYYKPSSYRPISLTSVLGKCMERVINARLYSFAEHHHLLDKEQEGFRERRGTTHALLRLVEDISTGLSENKCTAAVFIDMEKAFDTVWRNGLLVKLNRMGIKGKIWTWIEDFLYERKARCCFKNFEGNSVETTMGLPQGSVLSPLLFNLYLSDMFKDVESEKVKFADDGTIWRTDASLITLQQNLQDDLNAVMDWTRKWRMKLNTEKTEMCIFRKVIEQDQTVSLQMKGNNLKTVKHAKLLGVILDEKLSFNQHIQFVERKASKALGQLMCVAKTEKISAENMLKLYKSLVVPHLEYAAPVWQSSSATHCLEKIQRKGIGLCLKGFTSSSCDGLEVQASILPLDLRREEIAIRECTKIMAKNETSLIKQKLVKAQREDQQHKNSPMSKMVQQAKEMEAVTDIDAKCIEPELSYLEYLQPSRRKPDYWNNLGASNSRSNEQKQEARDTIERMILEEDVNSVVAFTDGSCKGNPGPCGAGACIIMPDKEKIELKQPVSKLSSILVGELVAIKMTLSFIMEERKKRPLHRLKIMSDSQTAIGVLTLGWKANAHTQLILEVQNLHKELERSGLDLDISWTPGHANIAGNEIADRLAKEAAAEAEQMSADGAVPISQIEVRTAAKKLALVKWQRRWETSNKARGLYRYRPHVREKGTDFKAAGNQKLLLQLQSGHNRLRHHLHRIGFEEDPYCECGEPETTEHFLLQCGLYEEARERMFRNLFSAAGFTRADVTEDLLLTGGATDPWKAQRLIISLELSQFVTDTERL